MTPEIKTIGPKKLVGKSLKMSFAKNRTFELWRSFMPRRGEIANVISSDLYSLQIYNQDFFSNFEPEAEFEKWAAIEVADFDTIPNDMESFLLPSGLYAVFNYKGSHENAGETYEYIFSAWLPASGYVLDTRPHFEIMGTKYKHGDPDSEEEIWIPVR